MTKEQLVNIFEDNFWDINFIDDNNIEISVDAGKFLHCNLVQVGETENIEKVIEGIKSYVEKFDIEEYASELELEYNEDEDDSEYCYEVAEEYKQELDDLYSEIVSFS